MSDLSDADRKRIKRKIVKEESESRRTRRQLWLAGSLFAVTMGVVGGLMFLLNSANARPTRARILEAQQANIAARRAELNREDLTQARIDKAKEMREHWRRWAIPHVGVLRRMFHAAPGNREALDAVYAALPKFIWDGDSGVTEADLSSKGMLFDWSPNTKGIESIRIRPITDPKMAAAEKKGRVFIHRKIEDDFEKYHDMELSRSCHPGSVHVILWASGRITRQQSFLQRTSHGEVLRPGEMQQVVAPFDEVAN